MKTLILLSSLIFSVPTMASELFCTNSEGYELHIEYKENPRNQSHAFVKLAGPGVSHGGWARKKIDPISGPETLKTEYWLRGSFPVGAILEIATKPRTCGRGACLVDETITFAKLVMSDETIRFSCI